MPHTPGKRVPTAPGTAFHPQRVLLATGEVFRYIQGANIFFLELTEHFLAQGCEVVLYSNLALPPMLDEALALNGTERLHIVSDPSEDVGDDFDLIFTHDNTLPDNIIDALENGLRTRIVSLHMSTFVHIERPLFPAIENSISDAIACVSQAVCDSMIECALDPAKMVILGNFAPDHLTALAKTDTSDSLRSLLLVSNHLPPEAAAAAAILEQKGVAVTRLGEGGTVRRIHPNDLLSHDAVMTIGKTVQYGLTLGTVPFVYDHFGGVGYLNESNWQSEESFTYSGRFTEEKKTAEQIADELLSGFAAAQSFVSRNQTMFAERYSLSNRMAYLLAQLPETPGLKKISRPEALSWKNFCEIYRGLYRQLEYFKDRTRTLSSSNRIVQSSQSQVSAQDVNIALQRTVTKPVSEHEIAVVVELRRQTMQRSLLSLRTQITAPSELHLVGAPDLISEATTILSEWASTRGVMVSPVPEEFADSLAAAVNFVAQTTGCGLLAALDAQTSWMHTFLGTALSSIEDHPDAAVVLHHSILAFVDEATRTVQYFFHYGPPSSAVGELLSDELLELKAAPLSNMLIRTQHLLDAGGLSGSLADSGAHALLLRLSRSSAVMMASGHAHSELVHYRQAGARESVDRAELLSEFERHERELIDALLKSPSPSDNGFALLLDRRRSQAALENVAQLGEDTADRLDLLLERVPAVGFETRLRMWAGTFPRRLKRFASRRLRVLILAGKRGAGTLNQLPSFRKAGQTDSPKLVEQADVVSFDVFDTLLDRPILRPSDVFVLASETVRRVHQRWITPEWPEQRVAAEQHCYGKPGIGPDITIEDIYAELKAREIADAKTLELLLQAELDTELEMLTATTRGKRLFDAAKRSKKTVLLLSDMYLPKELIETALTSAGYSGWERLVVSGYDKIGKHSGTAFARVTQDYPGKTIAHFGDNLAADVTQPRHYGVMSKLLQRPRDIGVDASGGVDVERLRQDGSRTEFSALDLARSFIGGMTERRLDRVPHRDVLSDIGYSVLGPALVGLSQWLDAQARSNGTRRLLFLAREGRLMMSAYRALLGERGLNSEYAYASRRMINLTQVKDRLTDAALDFLAATGTPLSISDYIRRFLPDLPQERIVAALDGTVLTPKTVLGPDRAAEIRAVFMRLEDELIDTIRKEQTNVLDYLRSVGADRADAGVVDIGWQGSIQHSIERSLNPNLLGYYFAVHDLPTTRSRQSLNGFVDPRRDHATASWYQESLIPGVEMVELLFANPEEASVSGVRKTSQGYEPVYSAEKLGPHEAEQVRIIQSAGLDFVRDFADLDQHLSSGAPRLMPEAALAPLAKLIVTPTTAQAQVMGSFPHDNSLGIVATPLGMPAHSAEHYRRHPAALREEYDSAWWKPGFRVNARALGIEI